MQMHANCMLIVAKKKSRFVNGWCWRATYVPVILMAEITVINKYIMVFVEFRVLNYHVRVYFRIIMFVERLLSLIIIDYLYGYFKTLN